MDKLIKKFFTREIILYTVFGVTTTILNIGCFALLTKVFNMEENLANILSILLAITVAFFTNRKMVFNSQAKTFKDILIEVYKFAMARAFTMFIEIFGFNLMFYSLHINEFVSKTFLTVLAISLNFVFSKLFIFKKK